MTSYAAAWIIVGAVLLFIFGGAIGFASGESSKGSQCFLRHAWGKWEQFEMRWKRLGSAAIIDIERRQKRVCTRCGKMQEEQV